MRIIIPMHIIMSIFFIALFFCMKKSPFYTDFLKEISDIITANFRNVKIFSTFFHFSGFLCRGGGLHDCVLFPAVSTNIG